VTGCRKTTWRISSPMWWDQLDLRTIECVYEEEERGQPPYHPRMMTKILLYGYCVGVFSSRRIEKKLREDVGFRVLAAGNEPDFRTISDFRKLHLTALQALFDQVLRITLQAGTMKLGRVILDGSKVKANASKHKAMSYGRMQEDQKRLKEEVKRLLAQAEATDAEEDARYGPDRRGDELPPELARRETRLKKIREAKRALEERACEQAKSQGKPEEEVKPPAKMQYNFSDPESRIMKGADGFVQAYNVQIAVEPDFQLIVGQLVTQEVNDKKQMQPVIEVIREQSGQKPAAWIESRIEIARSLAHAGRCRKEQGGWTACSENCKPRWARRFIRHERLWSNRCLDKSNRRAASVSFSCVD
jgi:transposase